MSIRLRVTTQEGQSREVNLKDGQGLSVEPGQRIEVLSENGNVVQAVAQGKHLVLDLPNGEHVVLVNFVAALNSDQPPRLVFPKPSELSVRLFDQDGGSRLATLVAGQRLDVPEGGRVEVLGTSLPGKVIQNGHDLLVQSESGETFTLGNVLVENGAPLTTVVSFPHLFHEGALQDARGNTAAALHFEQFPLVETPHMVDMEGAIAERREIPVELGGTQQGLKGTMTPGSTAPIFEDILVSGRWPSRTLLPDGLAGGIGINSSDLDRLGVEPATSGGQPLAPNERNIRQEVPGGAEETNRPSADLGLTLSAPDAAGNVTMHSTPLTVVVDTAASVVPVITGLTSGTDSGVKGDLKTNDATPDLFGTAEPNAFVDLYDGIAKIATTTADGMGHWAVTLPALTDGAHSLTAKATDVAGNVGFASGAMVITIDTSATYRRIVQALLAPAEETREADQRLDPTLPMLDCDALIAHAQGRPAELPALADVLDPSSTPGTVEFSSALAVRAIAGGAPESPLPAEPDFGFGAEQLSLSGNAYTQLLAVQQMPLP